LIIETIEYKIFIISITNEKIGFFSRYRWGPGSIITIILWISLSIIFFILYLNYKYKSYLFLSILSMIATFIILIVKGSENITIDENNDDDIIDKDGFVLMDIDMNKPGVVKIENQIWSAKSDEYIKKGERVIVVRREGLYLIVKKINFK
jgi:membrane protein implicated in regulation of membrane protease activity